MYDDSDLDAAVDAGELSEADAQKLRRFTAGRRSSPAPIREDRHPRYRSSWGDVLPALGLLLLLVGASAIATPLFGFYSGVVPALLGWALSGRFAARRAALPTGLLFIAFMFGFMLTLTVLIFGPEPTAGVRLQPGRGLVVAGGTALAAWVYWRRFRLPLAVPVTLLAAITLGDHLLIWAFPSGPSPIVRGWAVAHALLFFAAAMWWDMSDVYRQTIRSDVGFWMHGLAGFHLTAAMYKLAFGAVPVAKGWAALWNPPPASLSPGALALSVLICAVCAVLALIVDRRSLLACSLVFVVTSAFKALEFTTALSAVLVTGVLTVLLTLNWGACRRALLERLPLAIRAQVPRSDPRFWFARPVA